VPNWLADTDMAGLAEIPVGFPAQGRLLGVDLGVVRMGVAVSDSSQRVASPLAVLDVVPSRIHLEQLAQLVQEYQIVGLVVGVPLGMDGSLSAQAESAIEAASQLGQLLDLPVATTDERLTSVAVTEQLRASGLTRSVRSRAARSGSAAARRRAAIDDLAATELLKGFLDRRVRS
jgi:putative Holliday junction resolvase